MNRLARISLAILILTVHTTFADGKDSLSYDILSHRITAEIHPFYNIPNHRFYRGGNPSGRTIGPGGSCHLKYSFSVPGVYQGIGLAFNTFCSNEIIGSPVSLYIFQGARLLSLSPQWSVGYEWNLGISYGWKPNEVVSSRSNIYINVGLPFTWRPFPSWEIQIGPEYTHFSNGDTSYPNGGANTIGIRIGTSYVFGNDSSPSIGKALISADEHLRGVEFHKRIHYDVFIYGGWRARRIIDDHRLQVTNKAFALGGISFNPLYRLNRYFCIGPSVDIQTDTSTGSSVPSCGIAARGELEMPFSSINIGAGYNIIRSTEGIRRFYTTYNLKSFITRKIYLCIGYRLSAAQYTHNLMFGVGFRL